MYVSDCPNPVVHESTVVSVSGNKHLDKATYTCHDDYENISDDTERTCLDGAWSGDAPTCDAKGRTNTRLNTISHYRLNVWFLIRFLYMHSKYADVKKRLYVT